MTPDEYLNFILNKYTTFPNINYVNAYLIPLIQPWANNELNNIFLSGSYAKGTSIAGRSDLDLFISIKSSCTYTLKDIYYSLSSWLTQKGLTNRKQNVSLGLNIHGMNIDLVPGKIQPGYQNYHSIYKSKDDSWTQTNIKQQIDYVKNSNRLDDIRLMKIWRKCHNLDFPSFYLEMVIIHALKYSKSQSLSSRFENIMVSLRDELSTTSFSDPSNSNNTISNDLNSAEKLIISQKAKQTISDMYCDWRKVVW